jgi:hypothetical protein
VLAEAQALAKRGHRVMVVAPRYDNYPEAFDTGIRRQYPIFGSDQDVGYFHAYIDGVDFVFIDHSCFHHVKESIYAGDRCATPPTRTLVEWNVGYGNGYGPLGRQAQAAARYEVGPSTSSAIAVGNAKTSHLFPTKSPVKMGASLSPRTQINWADPRMLNLSSL